MEILKFRAPEVQVDPAFWGWVAEFKLTKQRLSTAAVEISGFELSSGTLLLPSQTDLQAYRQLIATKYVREYEGTFVNLNTIEDFLAFDRKGLLESILPSLADNPFQFVLVAFSDLKNYRFTFNCALPVLAPTTPLLGSSDAPLSWSRRSELFQGQTEKEEWSLVAGWVRFGSSVSRTVDLKEQLDPATIAQQAVMLNIQLMKWRIVPDLAFENFAGLKFLLLGAGTLGCSVARGLLGWGVKSITFVDNGRVSFSNPVRQSLFTFEDAKNSRLKAETAATRLAEITPGLNVRGVCMDIPMPRHPNVKTLAEFEQLDLLVDSHDVVLLLTDSRESRYFPSVMCAAKNKLAVSVALGFDSFLVKLQKPDISACYFCNDIAAPNDSTSHRSLDLQCTVTRPGVSSIASQLAVEIIAGLFTDLSRDPKTSFFSTMADATILGAVPDQIRGFLADFRLVPSVTEPSATCICCSPRILEAFSQDPAQFVLKATEDPTFLEEISNLKAAQLNIDSAAVLNFSSDEDVV